MREELIIMGIRNNWYEDITDIPSIKYDISKLKDRYLMNKHDFTNKTLKKYIRINGFIEMIKLKKYIRYLEKILDKVGDNNVKD